MLDFKNYIKKVIEKIRKYLNNIYVLKIQKEEICNLSLLCINYNMLNSNRKRTIDFKLESTIDFQRNTSIYLLYNYVGINRILEIEYFYEEEVYKFNKKSGLYNIFYVIYNVQDPVIIINNLYSVLKNLSRYYRKILVLVKKDELVRELKRTLLNVTKILLFNGMKMRSINPIKDFNI